MRKAPFASMPSTLGLGASRKPEIVTARVHWNSRGRLRDCRSSPMSPVELGCLPETDTWVCEAQMELLSMAKRWKPRPVRRPLAMPKDTPVWNASLYEKNQLLSVGDLAAICSWF